MIRPDAELYLNLMIKTLSFSLWPEPPWPLLRGNELRPYGRRTAISLLSRFLGSVNLGLVKYMPVSQEQRDNGAVQPLYGETMIGTKRLANIKACAETIFRDNIEGDFIETGVWRGGACIFMRAILAAYGVTDRKVYVADSFDGLPPPDLARFPADRGDQHYLYNFLKVSIEDVKRNFEKYDLLDDQVVFLKGYFAETLPSAAIGKLALLRLDGDMYGSTMDALENLYPKLQSGGFCIVDDFELMSARDAVNDYRNAHSIESPLIEIDQSSVFWRK
jgi:O-methyltransferase